MKIRISLCILLLALCLPGLASAQILLPFGYQARVVYLNGTVLDIHTFTLEECESQFSAAFNGGSGVNIVESFYCKASYRYLPKLIEKFHWDLGCLVCGVLDDASVHLVYPEHAEQVLELKDAFGIDAYRAELGALQRRYDLDGFQQRMGELQQEIATR